MWVRAVVLLTKGNRSLLLLCRRRHRYCRCRRGWSCSLSSLCYRGCRRHLGCCRCHNAAAAVAPAVVCAVARPNAAACCVVQPINSDQPMGLYCLTGLALVAAAWRAQLPWTWNLSLFLSVWLCIWATALWKTRKSTTRIAKPGRDTTTLTRAFESIHFRPKLIRLRMLVPRVALAALHRFEKVSFWGYGFHDAALVYREMFEMGSRLKGLNPLHDGDVVIDGGCNLGTFSLSVLHDASVKDKAKLQIYGFEPVPPTCAAAVRNLEPYPNVRVFNVVSASAAAAPCLTGMAAGAGSIVWYASTTCPVV